MDDLRVRVLGRFEIEGVPDTALGSRKGRTLLKALALARGRPVPVDRLVDILWPERPPARPADQVSVLVSRARAALGTERVVRGPGGYALVADWLDVDAMAELLDEAERRMATGATTAARAATSVALALARGPLLADEPDAPFAEVDRLAASRLEARAHHVGARAALAAGDAGSAAELAERALDHDPFDEDALRLLMTARARAGRPASALAAYARARAHLGRELGVDPSPETEALHTAILLGTAEEGDAAPPAAPLPGRAAELASLDLALAVGRGLVVVDGEPGMGKSRLLAEWAGRARLDGTMVLTGRCEELGRGLPLQPVVDAVTTHLRDLDDAEVDRVLGRDAALLGPLLGRSGTDGLPTGSIDQGTGQLLLFQAVAGVMLRLAPVALVLDDVHLAAPLTIEWLHFATTRLAGSPVLLVVATRTEEAPPLPAGRRVSLRPLDLVAATEVVGPEQAAELLDRSGGNPLFLVELAAADPDELPASIRDAVAARADRAGPEVAATLRAAAVLAEDVDLDLLAGALGVSPVAVLDHLEVGTRRGILVEEGDGFRFAHALVRSALGADTSASRRALLHRDAGRLLAARPRADHLAVAHHARLGGDVDLAAGELVAAAAVASARFDQAEAERLADESLALVETAAGRLAKARIALLLRRYEQAQADADRAFALGAGAAAREVAAWAAHYRRHLDEAIALADDGATIAQDDDERASCLVIGGWARHAGGDFEGAEVRLDAARRQATGASRSRASVFLGGLRVHQGRVEEGLALLQDRPDPAERLHGYPVLHGLMFRALGLATVGRAAEALATVDTLAAEVDRVGAERWAGRSDNFRGWILRNLGATAEADDCNERAVAATLEVAMLEPLSHGYLDLACGAVLARDPARAAGLLAAAAGADAEFHAMRWRHRLRRRLLAGRIALLSDDAEGALEAGSAIVAEAERLGLERYRVTGSLLVTQAHTANGDTVDPDLVGDLLEELPSVAGLEAWWITADVAAVTGNDRFRALAERRVAELAARAGPRRVDLERLATAYLS